MTWRQPHSILSCLQRSRVNPQLSRRSLGEVLQKNKRFSADGQNTAQNYTIMRVIVTVQFWTAIRHQNQIYSPILCEKVEIAVSALRKARVDNILAERVQAGGGTIIDVLTDRYHDYRNVVGKGLDHQRCS